MRAAPRDERHRTALPRGRTRPWASQASLVRLAVSGALAAATLLLFWPTSLGGATDYVTVDGTSMQPRMHTGDLVVVRRERAYHVGEVVAFRLWGGEVIHRLHAGNDRQGFTTKGDNRTTADPWIVHPDQIIGRRWLLLPGPVNPLIHLHGVIPLFAVALLLVGGSRHPLRTGNRRRRRIRKELPVPSHPTLGSPFWRLPSRLLAGTGAALLLSGLAAWTAFSGFTTPSRTATTVSAGPVQHLTYGYAVHVVPSRPGASGTVSVVPGSAVQPSISASSARTLDLGVSWSLPAGWTATSGTYQANATVTVPGGGLKTVPLLPVTPFTGRRADFAVSADLQSLLSKAGGVGGQAAGGVGSQVAGGVGGQAAGGRATPEISIVPQIITRARSGRGPETSLAAGVPFRLALRGQALVPSGPLTDTVTAPTRKASAASSTALGPFAVPVALARILGSMAAVLGLYALALVGWCLSRRWSLAIAYRMRSRFASALVRVQAGPQRDELLVPVLGLDDVARVASCNDGVINVYTSPEGPTVFARTITGTYVLMSPGARRAATNGARRTSPGAHRRSRRRLPVGRPTVALRWSASNGSLN